MKKTILRVLAVLTMLLAQVIPVPSYAAEYSNTVGGTLANTQQSFSPMFIFFGAFALIAGVWLAASGLQMFSKSQENNGDHRNTPLKAGLRILGGAALAALPDSMNSGLMTVLGVGHYTGGLDSSPGTVQTCLADAVNASSLSCVARNIGVNVAPVAVKFLFVGAMLVGLYIIIRTLILIATQSEHSRMSSSQLWWRLVVGIIACNVPIAMYVIQNTMGITDGVITTTGSVIGGSNVPSLLTYHPDSSVEILKQFSDTISWCFVFLSVVGVLSFIRGLSIMYSLTSGQGGHKTAMSAGVHMFAGVALANIKTAGCILVSTAVNQALGLCG